MVTIHAFLLILFSFNSLVGAITSKKPWQFSEDLMQQTPYSQQAPIIAPTQGHLTLAQLQEPQENENSFIDSKNIHSALNVATLCYVLFQIYKTYQDIYMHDGPLKQNADSYLMQAIKGLIIYLSPQFLINLGNHSQFLISSLAITLTALVYKTILKLIILSAEGDILDFLGGVAARLIKLIKTIVV